MTGPNNSSIRLFLEREYQDALLAEEAANVGDAWHHLERAHIVAQRSLAPHLYSHWRMLKLALRTGDLGEGLGQVLRLALAPLGNLTGRLPIGNTGRSDVSAFAHMTIPPDLRDLLEASSTKVPQEERL